MAIQFLNNPKVGDNVKIEIGDSSDLQIYHDGSNSYIKDGGTGNLNINATNLALNNGAGNKTYILATDGGSVQLRHNDSTKLETTSAGVTVSGDLLLEEANTPTLTLEDTTNNLVARFRAANSYAYITVDHADTVGSSRLVFQVDTTTPLYLDHQSNAVFEATVIVNGNGIDIDNDDDVRLRFDNTGTFKAGLQVPTTAGDMISGSAVNDFAIRSQGNMLFASGGNTERLRLDTSGNATFAGDAIVDGSVAVNTEVQFGRELLVKGEIAALAQDSGNNQLLLSASSTQTNISSTFGGTGSYAPMQFETGGAVRVHLTASGNLGIGTTSPTTKLTISDNSAQVLLIDTSSNNTLEVEVGDEIVSFKLDKDGAAENSKFVWSIDDETRMELAITEGNNSQLKLNNYGSGAITGTAAYTLQVDDAGNVIEGSTSGGGTVTGSGTATRVAFWSGTTALSSDANLYWDNTNDRLGIGTTSPISSLTVLGANSAAGGITLTSSTSNSTQKVGRIKTQHYNTAEEPFTTILTNAQSTANLINIGGSSGGENAATIIKFFTAANNTTLTGSERMRIDASGKVGIGTTAPVAKLQVSGSVQLDVMPTHESEGSIKIGRYDTNTSRFNLIKNFVSSTAASNYMKFSIHNGTANATVDVLSLDGGGQVQFNAYGNQGFTGTTAYALGVDSSGNVLELEGGDLPGGPYLPLAGGTMTLSASPLILPGEESNAFKIAFTGASASSGLSTVDQLGAGLYIGANSRVNSGGVVVTNNTLLPGSGIYFDGWSNDDMRFFTGATGNPSVKMIIESGGNVGIGTTAPQKVLDVAVSADSVATVGASLMAVGKYAGIHFGYRENNTSYRKSAIVFERTDLLTGNAQGKVHILNGPQAGNGSATLADSKLTINEYGNVGIGTTSPLFKLTVEHSDEDGLMFKTANTSNTFINFADPEDNDAGQINYDHQTNYMGFRTNGASRMRITSGGDVGIGTSNIQAKLDVQGQIRSTSNIVSNSGYDAFYIGSSRTINDYGGLYKNYFTMRLQTPSGNHAYGDLRFQLANSTSTTAKIDVMTLSYTGNVGIGNTAPSFLLDLASPNETDPTDFIRFGPNNGNAAGTSDDLGTGLVWKPNYTGYTKRSAGIVQIGEGNYFRSGLAFFTNNITDSSTDWSERMRISMDGNVGIGTASPGAKLEVFGTGNTLRLDSAANGSKEILFRNVGTGTATIKTDGDLKLYAEDANKNILFETNGGEAMRINSIGNLGLGTTLPTNGGGNGSWLSLNAVTSSPYSGGIAYTIANAIKAYHYVESGYLRHQAQSGVGHRFTVNGTTDAMYMTSAGNVGIGTTSPGVKLEVVGDSRIYDSLNVGYRTSSTSTTNYEPRLILSGKNNYADGTTWYGNYGQLLLTCDANMSSSARRFLITNALDNNKFAIVRSANATSNPVVNSTATGVNNGTADFVIDNAGKIGIGTDNPASKLHIYQNSTDTSTGAGITIEQDGTGDAVVQYLLSSTRRWTAGVDNSDSDRFKISSSADVGTDTVLTINTSEAGGRVGIGTTNPGGTLDVDAPSTTANSLTFGAAAGQIFTNENSEFAFGLLSAAPYPLYIQGRTNTNTARDITLQGLGGDIGIGTYTPGAKLHVAGASVELRIESASATGSPFISFFQTTTRRSYIHQSDSGNNLELASEYGGIKFFTGTGGTETEKMVIQSDGDVGIGVTNPVNKLQVGGKIYSSTDIQANAELRGATLRLPEGGNGSDLSEPVGFIDINVDGTVYVIPYYTRD